MKVVQIFRLETPINMRRLVVKNTTSVVVVVVETTET